MSLVTDYTLTPEEEQQWVEFLQHPEQTGIDLQAKLGTNPISWLYEGLVCNSVTMFIGEPKSGKTTLAMEVVSAFTNNTDCFGIPLTHKSNDGTVLVLTSELGHEAELLHHWQTTNTVLGKVGCVSIDTNGELPTSVVNAIEFGRRYGLVVVDNVAGVCSGVDLNTSEATARLRRFVKPMVDVGIPVVLIHHANKTYSTNAVSSASGHSTITGFARHLVKVSRNNNGVMKLHPQGNVSGELAVSRLAWNSDGRLVSGAVDGGGTVTQRRKTSTLEKNHAIAKAACESKAATVTGVAKDIADKVGASASTLERKKLPALVKANLLVKNEDTSRGVYSAGVKLAVPV